ncbi:acyl carrier protein [Fodinisporobacter ferrooxydans]|uniref:Acyl carrier protein n=1 Tax=Fodinisporobacter ferrooxydans TaxID=2901836 RepID=A0ABY4CLQ9_9BACL|nr:acyl carrier protein [Alicyclobacillaceae bacterium MYW30-H2]
MNYFHEIQEIVAKVMAVDVSAVKVDSKKEDFERWDSLEHLNLIMEIEAELRCSFSIEEIAGIQSVQDIVSIVGEKLG